MKELDLLKKDWQKNGDSFEQISEVEIYTMIHKKSSSVVKWILIVSILEFVVLNGIGYLLSNDATDNIDAKHPYFYLFTNFNYLIIVIFIILFYKNYKTISTLDSSKKLIGVILKTRQVVTYYIYWNIFIAGLSSIFGGIEAFNDGFNNGSGSKTNGLDEHSCIAIVLFSIVMMAIIWLFYKLIYGRFLSKLKENYIELKKIDL